MNFENRQKKYKTIKHCGVNIDKDNKMSETKGATEMKMKNSKSFYKCLIKRNT